MSYGLPNMSEMLTYADQEVKDMAAERRIKRRADFEKKSNNAGPPSKIQKTDDTRFVIGGIFRRKICKTLEVRSDKDNLG